MSSFESIWENIDMPDGGLSTDELRKVLAEQIWNAIAEEEDVIIKSPTAAGKSYLISSLFEGKLDEDEFPTDDIGEVLHLSMTTDARDEGEEVSDEHEVDSVTLKGREDTCPVAAGDHDDEIKAPGGMKPSEWFDETCDFSGVRFSEAHKELREFAGGLPCSNCESIRQYEKVGEGRIIHATHNFAYVEHLTKDKTVIFDERPSFSKYYKDEEKHPFKQAVTEYLNDNIDFEYKWADLMSDFRRGREDELNRVKKAVKENLEDEDAESHWNNSQDYSYVLAPEVILAIISAEEVVPSGKSHSSRYLGEYDGLKVVFDGDNNVQEIHNPPDLSDAKNVICLDAHPSPSLWRMNLGKEEEMEIRETIGDDEQTKWRIAERNLYVVQVGKYTRSYTGGWGSESAERKAGDIITQLRRKYANDFCSCISSKEIETRVRGLMEESGTAEGDLKTLHYGEQKSSNKFEGESVGLVVGCIDPGDSNILNKLALLGAKATPEEKENPEEGGRVRKEGRLFVGPDKDIAKEILESMREENVAQGIGRFARNPNKEDSKAIVYVWTDAIFPDLLDEGIDDPDSPESDKGEIQRALREASGSLTKKEISEEIDCSGGHILRTLSEMVKSGSATVSKETGYQGAKEFTTDRDCIDLRA